jgi:hypothetical protein
MVHLTAGGALRNAGEAVLVCALRSPAIGGIGLKQTHHIAEIRPQIRYMAAAARVLTLMLTIA